MPVEDLGLLEDFARSWKFQVLLIQVVIFTLEGSFNINSVKIMHIGLFIYIKVGINCYKEEKIFNVAKYRCFLIAEGNEI